MVDKDAEMDNNGLFEGSVWLISDLTDGCVLEISMR